MTELLNAGSLFIHPPGWRHPVLQQLQWPKLIEKQCGASVLRLDQAHPVVSGNKWFKLQYYLQQAKQSGASQVVTFGGPWSNHLVAAACACSMAGIRCTGIVRGGEDIVTETLSQCAAYGMQLQRVSRAAYRTLQKTIHEQPAYKTACIVPEGGAGPAGCRGAAGIAGLHDISGFSHILCAVGTGTTMAGLITSALPHQTVMGVNVLKGGPFQEADITRMTGGSNLNPHRLLTTFHWGGYAKQSPALTDFMNEWYRHTGIPTDFVYTGKLFYAFCHMLEQDYFLPGSNILVVHSGGLQGNASLPHGLLIF